jgi:hypothetical protein
MVDDDSHAVEKFCVVPRLWTIFTKRMAIFLFLKPGTEDESLYVHKII